MAKKTQTMKLLTTLFLATSIVSMAFVTHKDVSVRHTAMDTQVKFISTNFSDLVGRTFIDTPKYRYFIVLTNPNQFLISRDSVTQALRWVGRALAADDADYWQNLALKHLSLMQQSHVSDSVLIEAKPIVKPKSK